MLQDIQTNIAAVATIALVAYLFKHRQHPPEQRPRYFNGLCIWGTCVVILNNILSLRCERLGIDYSFWQELPVLVTNMFLADKIEAWLLCKLYRPTEVKEA